MQNLNIHDLVIASNFNGKGTMKQILKAVDTIALELGCCKPTLEILDGNKRASMIDRCFGFEAYELEPKLSRASFFDKEFAD